MLDKTNTCIVENLPFTLDLVCVFNKKNHLSCFIILHVSSYSSILNSLFLPLIYNLCVNSCDLRPSLPIPVQKSDQPIVEVV